MFVGEKISRHYFFDSFINPDLELFGICRTIDLEKRKFKKHSQHKISGLLHVLDILPTMYAFRGIELPLCRGSGRTGNFCDQCRFPKIHDVFVLTQAVKVLDFFYLIIYM